MEDGIVGSAFDWRGSVGIYRLADDDVMITALDEFEEHVLATKPTLSHLAARQEIRQLISALRLPTDERGRNRADIRRKFAEATSRPISLPDIFAN